MRHNMLAIAIFLAVTLPIQAALAISSASSAEASKSSRASKSLQASKSLNAFLATAPFTTRPAPVSTTTDLAAVRSAVLAGKYSRTADLSRNLCPLSCSDAGTNPINWFAYHSVDRLSLCKSPMLLDFALLNQLDDSQTQVNIAACTADLEPASGSVSRLTISTCKPDSANLTEVTSSLQFTSSGSSSSTAAADVVSVLGQLHALSTHSQADCNETINYAYAGKAVVGVYVGPGLASQGVITSVREQFTAQVQNDGNIAENLIIQLCDNSTARYSLGIVVNTNSDLNFVQNSLQTWKNSSCLTLTGETTPAWNNITFLAPSLLPITNSTTTSNSTKLARRSRHSNKNLVQRGDCTTVKVVSGDTCGTLAAECGITAAQFTTYNPSSTLCSSLAVGMHVCCTSGTLPDFTPKPDPAGNCASYLVVTGDSCSSLAAANGITNALIESYNTKTWGWYGCSNLLAGYNICLSSGFPPMPTLIKNAICGPQMNGTAPAPHGTDLSTLNECPLNACCDVWGQCGTTDEFCTVSNSSTGAPGTAAPGQNGCISNCGTAIVTSASPASPYSVAYFEGFGWTRPCLKMNVDEIDLSLYTHIHFAFATFNSDWSLNTTAIDPQLPFLVGMTGVKKIISIGGWNFCTLPESYMLFREVVSSEANRAALISNVVNFMIKWNLDGVDWDWEYPDEPDIPGIPAGTEADGIGYFLLMDELRTSIQVNAPGKTVSITAPASYWYLKPFPILALSVVVDYIVYMTYDLHGQWDYGKAFSDPGCPTGNCLRSHVNLTETINSLSMLTKAGVPSNMVVVGVSSYARSFEMTTPGCWTEMCGYTGPDSGATPGVCTGTAGYISNYELDTILANNPSAQTFWDQNSYSNMMVYNSNQWAAYMNDSNKLVRQFLYEDLSFLGSADWALDLQHESTGGGSTTGSNANETIYINPNIWSSASAMVTALPGVTLIWPPKPLSSTTTISFPPWTTTVSYSSLTTLTSLGSDGVTSTYPWYVYVPIVTVISIPPVTTTAIPVWGVTLGSSSSSGAIYLTSSIQPPPFAITLTPVMGGTTSIIGASTTSTSSGTTVIWGDITWVDPPETATAGQSTTIIGGITLPPTVMSVTPNPHPTTTPTSRDTILNSNGASWTSGAPIKPTSNPGCAGCGTSCVAFCDPDCPFCPPGVMGGGGGGGAGGNPNDPTSTGSKSSSTSYTTVGTALYDMVDVDDAFPTLANAADLLSIASYDITWFETMAHITPPPTTTIVSTTTVIPTTTVTATPTPHVGCEFWDSLIAYEFEIYNIYAWGAATDGGAALETQEQGCGALTYWQWIPATSTTDPKVYFYLPITIKAGCVERAIVSAGGPQISCVGGGLAKRSLIGRDPMREGPQFLPMTDDQRTRLISVYGNTTTSDVSTPYAPMD